jgi:hypothetical protein
VPGNLAWPQALLVRKLGRLVNAALANDQQDGAHRLRDQQQIGILSVPCKARKITCVAW